MPLQEGSQVAHTLMEMLATVAQRLAQKEHLEMETEELLDEKHRRANGANSMPCRMTHSAQELSDGTQTDF